MVTLFHKLFTDYHTTCYYCGDRVDRKLPETHPKKRTRDHIIPASKGGGNGSNLVPACRECNLKKRSMTIEEYRQFLYGESGGLFFGETPIGKPMRDTMEYWRKKVVDKISNPE